MVAVEAVMFSIHNEALGDGLQQKGASQLAAYNWLSMP